MNLSVAELSRRLGGEVSGDADAALSGLAPASSAKAGNVTFAENEKYFAAAESSAATAVIVPKSFSSAKKTLIRVENPRVAFAKAVAIFFPEPKLTAGIHSTAVVAKSAQIDATAQVGPNCVIGEDVKIGAGCELLANVFIGDGTAVGADTKIFPNVSIYPRTQIGARVRIHSGAVIGADGFGYVFDAGIQRKIPQIGNVVIGDDVEIGANTCVDRGALGPTTIGRGTKIDNLVQIAHNVQIGEHCVIMGQTGMAGSTKLGNYVIVASQTGLAGHLTVGDQVVIGAKSGVMGDVEPGKKILGTPAEDARDFLRQTAALRRLPELLKKIAAWEKKFGGE